MYGAAGSTSFFDALRKRAREAPLAVAAVDGNSATNGAGASAGPQCFTYAELMSAAERLAGPLAEELGGQVGGREWSRGRGDAAEVVTSMRRGSGWYCVFWAAARLQAPLVAMSCDLPDAPTERIRNAEIAAEHRPILFVVDDAGQAAAQAALAEAAGSGAGPPVMRHFLELWHRASAIRPVQVPYFAASADSTLCFCYTGGTTKASRCARITHRMALHEVDAYPQVVKLSTSDSVLQQHSLYWGASAFGEVDIALAFGCALVFAEAWDTEGLTATICANKVTCAGLVPSVLAAIDHADVPSLRCVFTWGEALQVRVAQQWARSVHLIDLLISTECWLSLYADWSAVCSSEQIPSFVTVPGTQVRLKPVAHEAASDGGGGAPPGDSGELLVAGAMVSPGYTDAALSATAFEVDGMGRRWYCTKDCLKPHGNGYIFAGRADDLVKVGGVWVDTRDIETKIRGLPGVAQACLCRRDVFVVLRSVDDGVIQQLRAALPQDFALYVVPSLPLSPGTGKVNRRRLWEMVASWRESDIDDREAKLCGEELASLVSWYGPCWALVISSAYFNRDALQWPDFAGDDLSALLMSAVTPLLVFGCRVAWETLWRALAFSYMALSAYHLPDKCQGWCGGIPFRELGLALLCSAAVPDPVMGLLLAGPGVLCAVRRGRLFSWPVVCAIGVPIWLRDQGYWMTSRTPSQVVDWYARFYLQKRPSLKGVSWKRFALARRLGLSRECDWCKKLRPGWQGHAESLLAPRGPGGAPAAGVAVGNGAGGRPRPRWYCNICWLNYDKYNKCGKCDRWSQHGGPALVGGAVDATQAPPVGGAVAATPAPGAVAGVWLCWTCQRGDEARSQPKPQGPGSRPSSKNGALPIQRRIVSLTPQAPTLGAKRPLEEAAAGEAGGGAGGPAQHPDQPAPKRLQLSAEVVEAGATPGDAGQGVGDVAMSGDVGLGGAEVSAKRPRIAAAHIAAVARPGAPGGDNCTLSPASRAATAAAQRPRAEVVKSREWSIIERATDITFDSSSESLSNLDSLRLTKLTSALRREVGKRLPRQVLKNAATLGALLTELERIPIEDNQACSPRAGGPSAGVAGDSRREYAAWGMMWTSRCQWVIHARRPLPESIFREAIGRLIDRHPALRAELRDPYRLFPLVQQALSVYNLWGGVRSEARPRTWRRAVAEILRRPIGRVARWALRAAWPRVGGLATRGGRGLNGSSGPYGLAAGAEGRGILVQVFERSATMQDAEWKLWTEAREFKPPFRALLAPYGKDGEEGALLHLTVTHMLSDGYCVVPLVDDLINLVSCAEAAMPSSPASATPPRPLPPVPDMFATLEKRIMCTIDGTEGTDALFPRITPHAVGGKVWKDAHTTFATLPTETVAAIRRAATSLGVPDDIAMLTVLGITLARFANKRVERVAMIVPQRDGPGENDMVGLFSDVRHLTILTDGLSVAGVALRLHHIVKERLWSVPALRTQFELPMVNFEWTDLQEKNGFAQHVNLGERTESSFHPLRIAVDQPESDVWRMRVAFQEGVYTEAQRDVFFELFESSLRMLRESPLDLVWKD